MDSDDSKRFRVVCDHIYSRVPGISNVIALKPLKNRDQEASAMTQPISLEEMWKEVERFYTRSYGVKFKKKLAAKQIEFLYQEMKKLKRCLEDHQEKTRSYLRRL